MELTDYGLSRERGFLSHYEIDEIALPDAFAQAVAAADDLSALLTTGRARHWLEKLPDPAIEAWKADLDTEDAKYRMRARPSLCEFANANAKTRHTMSSVLVRGLSKVTCVALLVAITNNIVSHLLALQT